MMWATQTKAMDHHAQPGCVPIDGAAPHVVLIATAGEVEAAIAARARLSSAGIVARVVAMESITAFDRRDDAYRQSIFPNGVKRIAIHSGAPSNWWQVIGLDGAVVDRDRSASFPHKSDRAAVTVDRVVELALFLTRLEV